MGFDQLLVVEPPDLDEAEFTYRIFNADGGEVENCGNGARCFARYVTDKGLTGNKDITVSTTGGLMVLSCLLYTSPSPRDATLSRMPSSA